MFQTLYYSVWNKQKLSRHIYQLLKFDVLRIFSKNEEKQRIVFFIFYNFSFELANKNKIIANLEAEIDSYKKKNEELETLRNNVGVVSRIKRIFA